MKKKMMILGGSKFALPLIRKAHELGIYVITVDYLPTNYAHKYSDLYVNISVVDKDAVLEKASELQIDGITSFACDAGVVTSAYVAEKMGLPNVGPLESVEILQDKKRFRQFLKDNNFNVPWFFGFNTLNEALLVKNKFSYPLIVKPTDSCGSKGVTKLDSFDGFEDAFKYAMNYSINGGVIVEEFLEKVGSASSDDYFSIDGELVYAPHSDQIFDLGTSNIYNPCGTIFPSTLPVDSQQRINNEVQRLIKLLGMGTTIYNIESRLCKNGKEYLMEVTPRGGGNRIAEVQSIAYNFDYIDIVVKSIMGIPFEFTKPTLEYPSFIYVLHSDKHGIFKNVKIKEELKKYLIELDLNVKKGDIVEPFDGAGKSIGFAIFKFNSVLEQNKYIKNIGDNIKIIVEGV